MKKMKQRLQHASFRFFFKYIGGVLPYFTAKQAFKVFAIRPIRHLPRASDDSLIKTGLELKEKFNGETIHGYQFGSGNKTVIVVHGYNSHALTMREVIKQLIADGAYTVIAFDAPGHGKSGGHELNNEIYINFLSQVFTKYPLYGLVGHSIGGICSLFALMNIGLEDKIVKKVLISAPVDSDLILDQFFRHTRLNSKAIKEFKDIVDNRLIRNGWKTFCINDSFPKGFNFSGMIIHDKDDTVIPYTSALKLSKAWPQAKLITTKNLGHSDVLRDSNSIKQVIDYINAP